MHPVLFKTAGILILALVLYRVGPHNIWASIRQLGLTGLLLALGCSLPHLACKSERWRQLLAISQVRIPASYAFFTYLAGIAMGSFTPGRAGEFFRAWLPVRDFGSPFAVTFSSVIVDRLFDLGFLALVSCIAALFLIELQWWLFLLPGGLAILYLFRHFIQRMLQFFYERIPVPDDSRIQFLNATKSGLTHWPHMTLWTVAGYTCMNLQVYVMAAKMGVDIGFWELFLLFGLANTIALLPVSVLGLGTREAALGALFVTAGHQETQGVAIALSFFLFGSMPVVVTGALWLLLHRTATPTKNEIQKTN